MDWEEEYNRSKAGRTDSVEHPFQGENNFNDDQPGRNDDAHGAGHRELGDGGRMRERVELLSEEEPKGTPLEQLSRHWMNERHAPDILPAQENLLAHLLDHLRRQVGLVTSSLISSD